MDNDVAAPLDDAELERVCADMTAYISNIEIPAALIAAWRRNNGFYLDSAEFYSSASLRERNELLEVHESCPNYVAVANDSGSRVALMKAKNSADRVYFNYSSSMSESEMEDSGLSLELWIQNGCPFELELESQPEISAVAPVVLRLDAVPDSGIKGLMEINKLLALSLPLTELRSIPDSLPYELCSTSYIKALRWAAVINEDGDIASIWSKESPVSELSVVNPFD